MGRELRDICREVSGRGQGYGGEKGCEGGEGHRYE